MKHILIFSLALALLPWCAHTTYTAGIPNLVQVRSNVWRSGQPTTRAEWRYLRDLAPGRKWHVLKLNYADESIDGNDEGAWLEGFDVHVLSIRPRTNPNSAVQAIEDVVEMPASDVVNEIERQVMTIPATDDGRDAWLVHCKNGHDRTGLVVGMIRLRVDHWSKKRAWDEMLARGFHPELVGLVRQWEKMVP